MSLFFLKALFPMKVGSLPGKRPRSGQHPAGAICITPSKRLEGARLGDKAIPWSCAWRAPQLRPHQSQMPLPRRWLNDSGRAAAPFSRQKRITIMGNTSYLYLGISKVIKSYKKLLIML